MMQAREIAVLARALPEDQATALIDQFARTFAAEAVEQAVKNAYEHMLTHMQTTFPARPS